MPSRGFGACWCRAGFCALFALLLAPGAITAAPKAAYAPKPGSRERKAIMDALRAPVRRELKKPVVLKAEWLKVQGEWAFMKGVPKQPDGKPFDYRGTAYQKWIDDGLFDDWVCALFRKKGGKWKVVKHAIGHTDVAWAGWDGDYGAPRAIFPYPR